MALLASPKDKIEAIKCFTFKDLILCAGSINYVKNLGRLGWVKSCTLKKLSGYMGAMILLLGNPGTDRDLCLFAYLQ